MKKILVLALILTMVFGTISASAQGFVPQGQAKKGILPELWMYWMEMREAQEDDDDNDEYEEMYGPFKMLPPGLQNKGTPPGLQKKGFNLPPGLSDRSEDELPPGIMMRFMQALQWEYDGTPVKEANRFEAEDYDGLLEILEDADYMDENIMIRLMDNIELEGPLVIEGERRVEIKGEANVLTLDEDEFDENDWMIIVEDGAELVLNNVMLDGALDEADEDDHLEGLVWVEEGGKLSTYSNDVSNAVSAFGYEMDEEDYDKADAEDLATYLMNRNDFTNIDFYLTIYDVDDLDEILFDLDVD